MKTIRTLWRFFFISLFVLLCISNQSIGADWNKPVDFEPITVTAVTPAEIIESQLKPGLTSWYYLEFFERDLRELPKSKYTANRTFAGKPILQLNHQFDKNNVFGSGTNQGVGIRMSGYIHFEQTGQYEMQALSNDGFILYLSDKLTINDPEQHSDRLSNVAFVEIQKPGWYPVMIEYFQRKGTAALKLMWKEPGKDEFTPLPPSVYAHQP